MAANGRGSMRPAGRSPPFLAIGLCVALVILGFNYWSLSARNGEQANELSLMESELRLANAKKTSSEKRSEALTDKVSDLEREISAQKEIIANNMAELQNAKQEKEDCARRLNDYEAEKLEMKDKLDTCDAGKEDLENEVQQLQDHAESLKNKQCNESACMTYIKQSREQTLREISQVAGNAPLIALYKSGGDVGRFVDDLRELAAQQNVPLQSGNNIPQVNVDQQQQQQQPQQQLQQQQQPQQQLQQQPQQQDQQQDQQQYPQQPIVNDQSQVNQDENTAVVDENKDSGVQQQVDSHGAHVDEVQQKSDGNQPEDNGNRQDQLFPADDGDGTNADEDFDADNDLNNDEDDYGDDDDNNLDDVLRVDHQDDHEEDYDYDDNDADNDRYIDNHNDLGDEENTIDRLFQADKEMEQN